MKKAESKPRMRFGLQTWLGSASSKRLILTPAAVRLCTCKVTYIPVRCGHVHHWTPVASVLGRTSTATGCATFGCLGPRLTVHAALSMNTVVQLCPGSCYPWWTASVASSQQTPQQTQGISCLRVQPGQLAWHQTRRPQFTGPTEQSFDGRSLGLKWMAGVFTFRATCHFG